MKCNKKVFDALKSSYGEGFHSSPSALRNAINHAYEHELLGDKLDVLSDKTIRNFFSSDVPPNTTQRTLDYLCSVLLDAEGYIQFCQSFDRMKGEQGISSSTKDFAINKYKENRLREKCESLCIPNMDHPVHTNQLYTETQIYEGLTEANRKTVLELLRELPPQQGLRPQIKLDKQNHRSTTGWAAVREHRKLKVLGKPGSGKTSFLKYLALNFREPEESISLVPFFISLKQYSEGADSNTLIDCVFKEFHFSKEGKSNEILEPLLREGQCLFLLDGLDEVNQCAQAKVEAEIDKLLDNYPHNRFIITSRLGQTDFVPNGFRQVEVVDFGEAQVRTFVENWFGSVSQFGVIEEYDCDEYVEGFLHKIGVVAPIGVTEGAVCGKF